jgi:hypothetical protein
MADASARRSFHGPIQTGRGPAPTRRASVSSGPLERVLAPPSKSSIGRAVIQAARTETPTTSERERVLAGVLSALQLLTRVNR